MSDALPFDQRRKIALHILTHGERLSRRAGAFAGQCAVDPTPLTPKQAEWFANLAERAGITLEAD